MSQRNDDRPGRGKGSSAIEEEETFQKLIVKSCLAIEEALGQKKTQLMYPPPDFKLRWMTTLHKL